MLKTINYVGKYLGGYRIILELASNSSSHIFLGESVSPDKQSVVIKRLHAAHIASLKDQESFLHDMRMLKQLDHPYILPILAADIDKGTPYIISEYASGGSLRDRLQRLAPGLPGQDMALMIISQIGQALAYAHQHNIVHGNLKLQNILFNALGEAQLADFKLPSLHKMPPISLDSDVPLAPEQTSGGAYSKESDLYALAGLAYEMFTGRKPFITPSVNLASVSYKTKTLITPTTLNPTLPPHIEGAILKAMAKDPSQRYGSVLEFLTALSVPTAPALSNTSARLRALLVESVEKYKQTPQIPQTPASVLPSFTEKPENFFAPIPSSSSRSQTQNARPKPFLFNRKPLWRKQLPFIILTCILLAAVITWGAVFAFQPTHSLQGTKTPEIKMSTLQPTKSTQQQATPTTVINTNKTQPAKAPTPPTGTVNIPPQPTKSNPPAAPRTGAPPPGTMTLSAHPGTFNASNCVPGNGFFTCTLMLTLNSHAGGKQDWYAYALGVVTYFSPSRGTIAPGQTTTIKIMVLDSCKTAGTFVFVGPKTNVTAIWNC